MSDAAVATPPPAASRMGESEFHMDRSPDAGIFADVNTDGLSIADIITLLYATDGEVPQRPDLHGLARPTAAHIATMVQNAEKNLDELAGRNPETKAILEQHFSGSDAARRPALCVMLYTMDTLPIPVYKWVNAWLNSTERNTKTVATHIGPFFVEYNKAMNVLPEAKVNASRAIKFHPDTSPKLFSAFTGYKEVFTRGKAVNFWGIASFTQDDDVMSSEDFYGGPEDHAIVFVCAELGGRLVSLLSVSPREAEIQPCTPSGFRVLTSTRAGHKLHVFLEQVPTVLDYENLRKAVVSYPVDLESTNVGSATALASEPISSVASSLPSSAAAADVPPTSQTSSSVVQRASEDMSERDMCMRAIEYGSKDPVVFNKLAKLLQSGEVVALSDGTALSKWDALLKVIELGIRVPESYFNAAVEYSAVGDRAGAVPLYVEALNRGGKHPEMFHKLGCALPSGGSVTLRDGTVLTQRDLFLKEMEFGGLILRPLECLAHVIASGEVVKLPDGNTMSERDLYHTVVEQGTTDPVLLHKLVAVLKPGEDATLSDGTVLSKHDLYVKAIENGCPFPETYYNVAVAAARDSSSGMPLINGLRLSVVDLYVEALNRGGKHPEMFHNLGCALPSGGSVTLRDGTVLTQRDLFENAVKHGSKNPQTFGCLLRLRESNTA